MRSRGASLILGIAGMLVHTEMLAQYRVAFEPSMQITALHDDNLFSSAETAARDVIQRFSPELALQVSSPLWAVAGTYAFDGDRFASHSDLSNRFARQRALIKADYRPTPRLTLALNSTYIDTNTPTDLNFETGLASARLRTEQVMFAPSANYRISSRLSGHASYLDTHARWSDGHTIGLRFGTVGINQRVTPRDLFTLDYEQGIYVFDAPGATRTATNAYVVRCSWARELDPRTRLFLSAGPRVSGHSLTPELSASLTHAWRYSSITIAGLQTQTTAIGSFGTVEARSLSARFTFAPSRSLAAYAVPAVFRNVHDDLRATVYQIGLGAHYAITPLIGLDIAYTHDSQRGAIDRLRALSNLSHRVLSVSLTTRWKDLDPTGAQRFR